MLNPLLAYQAIICNFSRKFRPSDWLNYDLAFHWHASINHMLQWDSYDEDAYDSFLRDCGISSCYGCGKPGHFLNNCQAKLTGGSSSSTSSIGKPAPNGMPTTSGGSSPITTLVTRPDSGNFRPTLTHSLSRVSDITRQATVRTQSASPWKPTSVTS